MKLSLISKELEGSDILGETLIIDLGHILGLVKLFITTDKVENNRGINYIFELG